MNDIESGGLTTDQLAGQRLMAGFRGTRINTELKHLIGGVRVGGIILFARNIETPDQLQSLCAEAQQYAAACGQPPLLIAVDQEGGTVARFRPPFTQFPGNPHIHSEIEAVRFAETTAREMKTVGINMDMAPVLDVALVHEQSVMVERAFSDRPETVASLGAAVIAQFQNDGIMAVAKHFPGIGRTTLDSHQDLPVLDTAPEQLNASDLIPFKMAVDKGGSHPFMDEFAHLRRHYSKLVYQYGDSALGVQWNDRANQDIRLEILTQIGDLTGAKILDFGCGTGRLLTLLRKNLSFAGEYIGYDINADMIAAAREKFPQTRFEQRDILAQGIPEDFDYVLISGVFNNRVLDNWALMTSLLKSLYPHVRKGLAFNALSTYTEEYYPELYFVEPEKVFHFCKTELSAFVTLRNDYLVEPDIEPYDFTIYVYRSREYGS